MRFRHLACCSQRPSQGIVTKDVTARVKFCSRESKRRLRRLVSRREIERQRSRIAGRAALAKLCFDIRRFVLLTGYAQRLGERPLIFWKRIEPRRFLQSINGLGEPVLSK